MQIEEIMRPRGREEALRILKLLKKTKALPHSELKKGGKYYKAYRSLQENGLKAMKETITDEVMVGFPLDNAYLLNIALDVVNDKLAMRAMSKAYFRLFDMELCDMIIAELRQKVYEAFCKDFDSISNRR